jgi:hypothetical protein
METGALQRTYGLKHLASSCCRKSLNFRDISNISLVSSLTYITPITSGLSNSTKHVNSKLRGKSSCALTQSQISGDLKPLISPLLEWLPSLKCNTPLCHLEQGKRVQVKVMVQEGNWHAWTLPVEGNHATTGTGESATSP